MQYQVPQFIETEDTIIWRFTIKQFIMLSGGALVCFFLYFVLQFWLWMVVALTIMGSGTALALVKINGQPLPKIVLSMAHFYMKPQLYVWHPELTKGETALSNVASGFDFQKIISGLALKNVWQSVQMRSTKNKGGAAQSGTRYELFRRRSGEPRVANRVDYR